MQRKWIFTSLLVTGVALLLAGFNANPAPQPQRVSDLVARIEALEDENSSQQAALNDLTERVAVLEAGGGATSVARFDADVTIPRGWVQDETSDGLVRYWHDPDWELATDEPGTMDLWMDENTAIFFTWDWGYELLDDLHNDEDFLRIFEDDLVWSDETLRMNTLESSEIEFMGKDAHYWDIAVESFDGYASRMLTIFYPCSDRTSCNVTFVRFDPDPDDDEAVGDFASEDWEFVNTFAHGVEFMSEGKASLTANANLRACPSTSCEVVGRLLRGEIVEVVAVSEDGGWFQLKSGEWILASLVFGAPLDLPTVEDDSDI